jgi:hypothetical protein
MHKAIGRSLDATMGHTHTVGNAAVGYGYANSWELEGAVLDKQSSEMAASATSAGIQIQINELERQWREVE